MQSLQNFFLWICCLVLLAAVAVIGSPDIFVTEWNSGNIVHLKMSGSELVDERTFASVPYPCGIDYDFENGQLYWTQYYPEAIMRSDLQGRNITTVANLPAGTKPFRMALDEKERKIFYTDWGNDVIAVLDMTSFNRNVILNRSSDVVDPHGLALDKKNRHVYWGCSNGPYIGKADYDGRNFKKVISNGLSPIPVGLAIDTESGVLYWCDENNIGSMNIDGSQRKNIVISIVKQPWDIFYVDSMLYIISYHERSVVSMQTDNGNVTKINSSLISRPIGLVVVTQGNKGLKPKVLVSLVHTGEFTSELMFHCNFTQHPEDVFYNTRWYVDDQLILSSDPEKWSDGDVINQHAMTESHLRQFSITTYGIEISCSVEATYEEGNISTPAVTSSKKFIGIKVSQTLVSLAQGESTDIELRLSAPFGCGRNTNNEGCRLKVNVHTQENADQCDQAVLIPSQCGASFMADSWEEPASVKLVGKITNTYGSSSKEVNLKLTSSSMLSHQMWGEAELSLIKVQLNKDTSHIQWKSCHSVNDPHMRTFDGRNYEHQYGGVFTMYMHTELPLEVQIQTASCSYSQNAWCNCGVAVRAGRTVFEINRCPGQSDIWFMDYTLCEDGGDVLQVKIRGSSYDIYLPTGAKIVVNIYGVFLNVQIYPSVQDIEKSLGLCGKMSENGACNDDFVLRDGSYSTDETATDGCNAGYRVWENLMIQFSESWRAKDGGNLFDHGDLSSLTSWPRQEIFCSCTWEKGQTAPLNELECSAGKAHETCKSLPGYREVPPSKCSVNRRRRRSVREATECSGRTKRQVGSLSGNWTDETARSHCEKIFQDSKSVQVCGQVKGVETNASIDNCVQDIMLTDTTEFGAYSVDTVRSQCYHEIVVNPVLQENDTSTGNQSIYDIVVDQACPGDCSGNGNCSEGECRCNLKFGGLDCSVDLSAPPVLHDIQDGGHCDTSQDSCHLISVYGETFTDGNTTCLVEALKVRNTSVDNEGFVTSAAHVQSISHVKCNISPSSAEKGMTDYVRAYRISVSNDGQIYSNNVSLLIYDGTCVTGNISGLELSWSKESSYCLYEEQCFINGTSSPDDECMVCMIDTTTTTWINSTGPNCTGTLDTTPVFVTDDPTTRVTSEDRTVSQTQKETTAATEETSVEQTTEARTMEVTSETVKPTTKTTTTTTTATVKPSTVGTTTSSSEGEKTTSEEHTPEPSTTTTTKARVEPSTLGTTTSSSEGEKTTSEERTPEPSSTTTTARVEPSTVGTTTSTSKGEETTEAATMMSTSDEAETTTKDITSEAPTAKSSTTITTERSTSHVVSTSESASSSKQTTYSVTTAYSSVTTNSITLEAEADSSRSKMDYNTLSVLAVAGGIVAFAAVVTISVLIVIKVRKKTPNNNLEKGELAKPPKEEDKPWQERTSFRSPKFVPRPYAKTGQFGQM